MAALAFVLAGCAKEISEPVTSGEIHFTATIAAHGSDTKTSYTEEGDDINVAWVHDGESASGAFQFLNPRSAITELICGIILRCPG